MGKKIFDGTVHFVAGKGGVGKTVVARALAQHFSREAKTLLIELCEDEAGDLEPRMSTMHKHPHGDFFHMRIFPDQTLYEYLTLKIPQKLVLESFMSQNLFRALGAAMPGLSDLTRLGKIWFHADEKHEPKGELFNKIVVDMPSSGFVTRFVTIARVVHNAVKIGPLAKEARLIHEYFADENNARLHVVALPQELVVNETMELLDELTRADSIHLGYVVLNRVLPHLDSAPRGSAVDKVLRFFHARQGAERVEIERLKKTAWPLIEIADLLGEHDEEIVITHMMTKLSGASS